MGEENDAGIEMPKWDVALASLVRDECINKGAALTIEDFSRIAREHSIRFDDIMETVFALCIHGQWRYNDADGGARLITQDEVNKLYVERRLYEKDLREYTGSWSPLDA
jgi:hypothetical protein